MKSAPTDLDRDAARFFTPAPGSLALYRVGIAGPDRWLRMCEDMVDSGMYSHPMALDADDPATAGCMLAQVRDKVGAHAVVWQWHRRVDGDADAFSVILTPNREALQRGFWCRPLMEHDETDPNPKSPTEGAALVAAMKKLKAAT